MKPRQLPIMLCLDAQKLLAVTQLGQNNLAYPGTAFLVSMSIGLGCAMIYELVRFFVVRYTFTHTCTHVYR